MSGVVFTVAAPEAPRRSRKPRRIGSEGFETRAHEHRASVALVDAALEQLAVQAHRAERTAARGAELEVDLERRLAPRATRELDPVVGLEAGVGECVDVPLAVV